MFPSMQMFLSNGAVAPIVTPDTASISRTASPPGTCVANVQFYANGTEFSTATDGSGAYNVSRGNWLDRGNASQVWIERVINAGTLSTDAGSGRLQMSSDRAFGVTKTISALKTATVTFNFYDAASGGNLLGTSGAIVLTADTDL